MEQHNSSWKNRHLERVAFYKNDNVFGSLSTEGRKIEGTIHDISAEGVSLLTKTYEENLNMSIGEKATINIYFGKKEIGNEDVIVTNTRLHTHGTIISMYYFRKKENGHILNRKKRIPVSDFFPICAWCNHPVIFDHKIFFLGVNISENGISVKCSLSNKFLTIGMPLELNINIPIIGETVLKTKIRNIRQSKTQRYFLVGMEFDGASSKFKKMIAEYLSMVNPEVSFKNFRMQGFNVSSADYSMFSYAKPRELSEIAELRKIGYSATNPNLKNMKATEFLDEFDSYSRHIVSKRHGKIISSIRVVFVNGNHNRSEISKKFGINIPSRIYKGGFIEVSKLVIHPDYDKTTIFTKIIREAFRVSLQEGVEFALCFCVKEFIAVYKKLGFEEMNVPKINHSHGIELNCLELRLSNLFDENIINEKLEPLYKKLSTFLSFGT